MKIKLLLFLFIFAFIWQGNAQTPCTPITAPWSENFSNAGSIPSCWTMNGGQDWFFNNSGTGHIGNSGTLSGATSSGAYFAWADANGNNEVRELLSPLINVSPLSTPALSFYEISNNEGHANSQLDVEVWDGVAWNNVGMYNTNTSGWEQRIIDLSGLTITGAIQIKFIFSEVITPVDFTDDIAIDDVKIDELPSCLFPTAINLTSITQNNAVLNWVNAANTPIDYNWEVQPQGTAQGTATAFFGTDAATGISVTGLTDNTAYDFFVQTNCGGSDLSVWVGPISFTTTCAVVTPDYNENFTTYLDPCWSESRGLLSITNTVMTEFYSSWAEDGFANIGTTGAAVMNIYTTPRKEWLISPSIDLGTTANLQLEFDIALTQYYNTNITNFGADDTLAVVISTDNGITWNTSNILQVWTIGTEPSNTGDNIIIDLSTYTGVVKIGFYAASSVSNSDNDLFIDNFWVRTPPACANPTVLNVSDININDVVLNWTNSLTGTAVDYNWEIQPQGTAQGTATSFSGTVVTNGVGVNGLTASTNYDVYVQTNCGGDLSTWNGPITFTTLCTVITPDYNEDFTTFLNPCWSESRGLLSVTNTVMTELYSYWAADGFANVGTTGAARIYITSSEIKDWLISPSIDLGTAGNLQLEFDIALTETFNTNTLNFGVDDTLAVVISTDNGITWNTPNILQVWTIGTEPSNTGDNIIIDLSAYTGIVKIGFYAASSISNVFGSLFIDNFWVKAPTLVSSITVQGQGGASTITTNAGTLQMEATILPANADNQTFTWMVVNGTGVATIDANGLLTADSDGDVTVIATANDASNETGTVVITISQDVLVTSITVQGQNGVSTISTNAGTLQMEVFVTPLASTDPTYTWSVVNGTGSATIDAIGLLTADGDGDVTVTATANDASNETGTAVVTITNQYWVTVTENSNVLISIFPNPTQKLVNLISTATIETVNVYNVDGKLVLTDSAANNVLNINVLAIGSYIIEIKTTDGKNHISRIVKN